ncbi:MAG: hypothetical protein M1823_001966 [Watsoniomyces obsoletus]|nr:MAG: hypothetical protein M1823_001966 [Watsoniomyces obsoletus]
MTIPVEGISELAERSAQLFEIRGVWLGTGILLFPGLLAFLMTTSEFALLQRTSVVTLSICGIFKEVVTIAAAGIAFHDHLTVVNLAGLMVTIASIAAYNWLKMGKMRREARMVMEAQRRKGDDDDDGGVEQLGPVQQQDMPGDDGDEGDEEDGQATKGLLSGRDDEEEQSREMITERGRGGKGGGLGLNEEEGERERERGVGLGIGINVAAQKDDREGTPDDDERDQVNEETPLEDVATRAQ